MVDRDDTADVEKADGALDLLHPDDLADDVADDLPAEEPVDWAGHVPSRRVATGDDPGHGRGGEDPGDDRSADADDADGYDPFGWLPSPRRPLGEQTPMPLTRMALARARVRLAVALDVVTFTAACPACGQDCEWVQERQDTKVRSTVNCPCCPF